MESKTMHRPRIAISTNARLLFFLNGNLYILCVFLCLFHSYYLTNENKVSFFIKICSSIIVFFSSFAFIFLDIFVLFMWARPIWILDLKFGVQRVFQISDLVLYNLINSEYILLNLFLSVFSSNSCFPLSLKSHDTINSRIACSFDEHVYDSWSV